MGFTVLQLAIPKLTEDLAPSGNQLPWIMDIYGFFLAGALITMGVLGDKIGRRKLLLTGALLFGAASMAAVFGRTADRRTRPVGFGGSNTCTVNIVTY